MPFADLLSVSWLRVRSSLTALLPCSCAVCAMASDMPVCQPCQRQFLRPAAVRCPQCAERQLGVSQGQVCGRCLQQQPAYDATIVATDYQPPVDVLIQAFKFGSGLMLASSFALSLRDAILAAPANTPLPDLLIPVPLGAKRLQERGYNQALEMARPLAQALGLPCHPDWVTRVTETIAQSSLHPDARRRNVKGVFAVMPRAMKLLEGRHIGVVDDVMTTGETLHAVAALLKRHGAQRVTNYVFARTPYSYHS